MITYTRAILRKPSKTFINALALDTTHQKPDYDKAIIEHLNYALKLQEMGLGVTICEPDENFPDGNFVEDTYLILDGNIKIELNPGAPSRAGEPMSLAPFLPPGLPFYAISKKFTIDGGDILVDGKKIYAGLSSRTQQEAIDELADIAKPFGYDLKTIHVPHGLHLKSGMTSFQPNHFVIQAGFEGILKEMQLMDTSIQYFVVPKEEDFAANVLAINGKIMLPTGCPITKNYLSNFYAPEDIFEVDTQQVRLVDGALTCGNLLFR